MKIVSDSISALPPGEMFLRMNCLSRSDKAAGEKWRRVSAACALTHSAASLPPRW